MLLKFLIKSRIKFCLRKRVVKRCDGLSEVLNCVFSSGPEINNIDRNFWSH